MKSDISRIKLNFSHEKSIEFNNYPLDEEFDCEEKEIKIVSDDLINVLDHPQYDSTISPGNKKIFLGFASEDPSNTHRFPLCLPTNLLTRHICIAGSIGSGKTSLSYRLIAGSLKNFGTVVIGEAKGGNDGFENGAAFTDLSKYLSKKLNITTYRWPRGNCWFNPLHELKEEKNRREFFDSIIQCLELDGDFKMFGDRVVDIILYLIDFLKIHSLIYPSEHDRVTLRYLVSLLDTINGVSYVEDQLNRCEKYLNKLKNEDPSEDIIKSLYQIKNIRDSLTNLNYFWLGNPLYIATRSIISRLYNMLKSEDLLHYSEFNEYGLNNQQLVELSIDSIIANRCLVVISQPLEDQNSKAIGVIFWDALHSQVLSQGIYKEDSGREKILAILDETDNLPTGKLGESGEYIRQYGVGLVQIMPSIRDEDRWNRLNQVCQTFISLTPVLLPMTRFIYDMLPAQDQEPPFYPSILSGESGSIKLNLQFNPNHSQPVETPGASYRSLNDTGEHTALIMLKNPIRLFWIDLESPILGEMDILLQRSLSQDAKPVIAKSIDYALGLSNNF
jgi:hypothetical protein